jgi:glutathione S-transferase
MMLLYQTHSPFARKVLVMAHETGLAERMEVIHHETSPVRRNAAVHELNPLGKVPVLICDDGVALFDSTVICAYLDGLHQGARLIPESGSGRWLALRLEALAGGMAEAGVAYRWETTRRPEDLRWRPMADGQAGKLRNAYDFIEQEIDLGGLLDIGQIAGDDARLARLSPDPLAGGSSPSLGGVVPQLRAAAFDGKDSDAGRDPGRLDRATEECGCRLVHREEAFDPNFLDRDVLRRPERRDRRENIQRNARLAQVDGKQWAGRILHRGSVQEGRQSIIGKQAGEER